MTCLSLSLSTLSRLSTASLLVQGLVCQRRSEIWRKAPGQLHSALIMHSWTHPSGTAPSPPRSTPL